MLYSKDFYELNNRQLIIGTIGAMIVVAAIYFSLFKWPLYFISVVAFVGIVVRSVNAIKNTPKHQLIAIIKIVSVFIAGIAISAINTHFADHHTYEVKYPLLQLIEIPIALYIIYLIQKANKKDGVHRQGFNRPNKTSASKG